MAVSWVRRKHWEMDRDDEGHRTYTLELYAMTTSTSDGPATVLASPLTPQIGDTWVYGGDTDSWAFCKPNTVIAPLVYGEPSLYWELTYTFSTKPGSRCQDEEIEDPLLEPQKVSGSFTKYTQEVTKDKDGDPIKTSSHEIIRGPAVEFDFNRPTVVIEQNVQFLELDTVTQMIDTVNDAGLWDMLVREVKLSNFSWERRLYGVCNFYFTRKFEFELKFGTFDRTVLDEGTKVLKAGGNKNNPQDFVRATDENGNIKRVLLDGNGAEIGAGANPANILIQHYEESNFLELGIPTDLTFI